MDDLLTAAVAQLNGDPQQNPVDAAPVPGAEDLPQGVAIPPDGLSSPPAEDAPSDEQAPAPAAAAPDVAALQDRLARLEAEKAQRESELAQAQAFQQQALLAQAQAAWQQQEQQALGYARQLEPELGIPALAAFYQQRLAQMEQQMQALLHQHLASGYRQQVLGEIGPLSQEERTLLETFPPEQLPAFAGYLKARREREAALEAQIKQSTRAAQASQVVASRAHQVGGTRASGVPSAQITPGSDAHLKAILFGTG